MVLEYKETIYSLENTNSITNVKENFLNRLQAELWFEYILTVIINSNFQIMPCVVDSASFPGYPIKSS